MGAAQMENTEETANIIQLTARQEQAFQKGIKIGLTKRPHKKGMITNEQLTLLIKMQKQIDE